MKRLMVLGVLIVGLLIGRRADAFFREDTIKKTSKELKASQYKGPPHIDSIEPSLGAPNIPITIKGRNLGSRWVRFGWQTAEVIDYSDDKIVVRVPPPPYRKNRTVKVKVGTLEISNSLLFTYKDPEIKSIFPSSGKIDTEVTIEGRYFGVKGIHSILPHPTFWVKFGKSCVGLDIKIWEDKKIVVKAPSDYGTGKLDERMTKWMIKFAIAGATGGITIPEFVLDVIKDLATSGVRIPPGKSKILVDVAIRTPVGTSNTKVFTYQLSDENLPPEGEEEVPEHLIFAVYATRAGHVGDKTANGHLIQSNDHFVALPSNKVLCSKGGRQFEVRITYQGKSVIAPVWDVGPWNIYDNYWEPELKREIYDHLRFGGQPGLGQGIPEAQAAKLNNYNKGFSGDFLPHKLPQGQYVKSPAGIDLADGTWNDLGMTDNDWVTVEFLWTISKPVSPEEGLVTALVIDRSGSMRGEKIKKAKIAAYIYVNTSQPGRDSVSLAAFSSDGKSIAEPISINNEGKEILKKDISSLSAGGNTNVGSGLTIALGHLSSSNRKDKKAVLISDGRHNTGTYKPEVAEFQKRGWPIYTVAFGGDADREMLNWIANQTGGQSLALDMANIGSGYHKINVMAHNGSIYRSYNDFIRPGQKLTYNIPVEPDMKRVGFFTNWQGSKMETILFSPSKTMINRSNISNQGRFIEGETHSCFEIDNPQCGNWQAIIAGYDLPSKGEQVNFHSFCQSDIFSNVLSFQPRYSQNQEVQIGVKLAEVINGRLSPLRGAQPTAEIRKPSPSLEKFISKVKGNRLQSRDIFTIFQEVSGFTGKITLYDDGLHKDVRPGDGIYANSYKDTTINGPYLVTINFQGYTAQGMPVKRTLQESFQVGPIEQNSFTVSDFLNLINQQGNNRQAPRYIPGQEPEEIKPDEIIKNLLGQFLKQK